MLSTISSHQAVPMLSHHPILSRCHHPITSSDLIRSNQISSSHLIKLSTYYHTISSFQTVPCHQAIILSHHLISLSCPHAIKSSHIIMLSPCYHTILCHKGVSILSNHTLTPSCPHPITLWHLINLSTSYHITWFCHTKCCPSYYTIPPHHILSHHLISSSCPHPIRSSHTIKLTPSYEIIQSHQAVSILSHNPI